MSITMHFFGQTAVEAVVRMLIKNELYRHVLPNSGIAMQHKCSQRRIVRKLN
jgi:hypothetical protein